MTVGGGSCNRNSTVRVKAEIHNQGKVDPAEEHDQARRVRMGRRNEHKRWHKGESEGVSGGVSGAG